ncbi:MAG: protein kinase [Acidobacteria bacterium]|nr:protein kinase [Acidobacteriota bacterium]
MLKQLGKYEVIEELGKGAMGIVYKAYDSLMARYVALKTMSYTNAADPDFKKRFYKEAQAPGRLRHDNIVIIYELGEDQGIPFIAMEFLEGSDLLHLMQSGYIFTLKKVIDIVVQVCEGLNFAHQNGIIHRDVKPANIFLLPTGRVKIVDFGIAQISQSSLLTKTGVMLGTPSYMSPEAVKCDPTSGRSDQFAVGVILFELLTGRRPFEGENYTSILYKILHEKPASVRDFFPTCPAELEAVVMKALSKNPDDRFMDLSSMSRRLKKFMTEMDQDAALDTTISITRSGLEEPSLKVEVIQRYIREGKFDLASRVLDRLRSSGESAEILEALYGEIQEKKRAIRIDELLSEGSNFYEDDHFDLALECFNEALIIDPENPRALEWVRKTHQKESEKRLRQSIEGYIDKGRHLMGLRQFSDALRVFGEAIKLNPSDAELAEMYRTAEEAVERSEREEECRTLCRQARSILEKGNREEAKTVCRKVVEILPDFKEAETLLQEVENLEKEEIVSTAVKKIQSLALKRKYNLALSLAGETVARTGMDPRLQTCIRNIHRQRLQIWLLVTGILAAAAILIAFLIFQPGTRPAPPPPPAPGHLVLDVRPAATVTAIADAAGKPVAIPELATPLRLQLPPGKYTVTYENKALQPDPVKETVTIESGKALVVSRKFPGFNTGEAVRDILGEGGPQ